MITEPLSSNGHLLRLHRSGFQTVHMKVSDVVFLYRLRSLLAVSPDVLSNFGFIAGHRIWFRLTGYVMLVIC
jgi:hypothetical protein